MSEIDEFREEVKRAYAQKKNEGLLPGELERPSPAILRDFCRRLLRSGLSSDDMNIFLEFFNPQNQQKELDACIQKFDLNKLESLRDFVIGDTRQPREVIVKLSAILIDFQPRPFDEWRKIRYPRQPDNGNQDTSSDKNEHDEQAETMPGSTETKQPTGEGAGGDITPIPPDPPPPPARKPKRYQLILLYIGIVTVICVGGFFLIGELNEKQCMYWEADRYVAVDCEEKITGIETIAKDPYLLENFRKITRPDTLTAQHANTVWYSKINNQVEFFTSSGFHPVHRDKSLKAATKHIIEQYAVEK